MNYVFEVFHTGMRYKYDTYQEAIKTAKQLTSSGCYLDIEGSDTAYIVQRTQLDNSDERISITKVVATTKTQWYMSDLM